MKPTFPKNFALCCVFLLLLAGAGHGQSPASRPLRVLFVGNSYTYYNNLEQVVTALADSTPVKLTCRKSTVGGAFLSEHWLGQRGLKTKDLIKTGKFDVVVLQDNSMAAIERPDSVYKYVRLLCDWVRESGGRPYLYATWAREKVPQYQPEINAVYAKAAKDNKATLVPAGNAWSLAKTLRPTISLYDADGSHPNNLGTYLTACVFATQLAGELDPRKMASTPTVADAQGESIRLMALDPLDVTFCQKVARQVVREAAAAN